MTKPKPEVSTILNQNLTGLYRTEFETFDWDDLGLGAGAMATFFVKIGDSLYRLTESSLESAKYSKNLVDLLKDKSLQNTKKLKNQQIKKIIKNCDEQILIILKNDMTIWLQMTEEGPGLFWVRLKDLELDTCGETFYDYWSGEETLP